MASSEGRYNTDNVPQPQRWEGQHEGLHHLRAADESPRAAQDRRPYH